MADKDETRKRERATIGRGREERMSGGGMRCDAKRSALCSRVCPHPSPPCDAARLAASRTDEQATADFVTPFLLARPLVAFVLFLFSLAAPHLHSRHDAALR